jgi:hypothetical protein
MANGLTEVASVAIHGPDERNQLSYPIGYRRIRTVNPGRMQPIGSEQLGGVPLAETQGENAEGLKASLPKAFIWDLPMLKRICQASWALSRPAAIISSATSQFAPPNQRTRSVVGHSLRNDPKATQRTMADRLNGCVVYQFLAEGEIWLRSSTGRKLILDYYTAESNYYIRECSSCAEPESERTESIGQG